MKSLILTFTFIFSIIITHIADISPKVLFPDGDPGGVEPQSLFPDGDPGGVEPKKKS